jgi:predicted DsbA family dithiol-disulfide isomerase
MALRKNNAGNIQEPVPYMALVLHWFDFLCPFCYVGQGRNTFLRQRGFTVEELPFQAHPEIPESGISMRPRVGPMYASLEREANAAGLVLNWPSRLPNTRLALEAAEWIRKIAPDASSKFNTALFAAHFENGEDLGDLRVIDRYARQFGVDIEAVHLALADGSARTALTLAEALGRKNGVRGTPAWLIKGEMISGLLPIEEFDRLTTVVNSA